MTAPSPKFHGPAIQSVMTMVRKPEAYPEQDQDPKELMFKTYAEALEWRNALSDDDLLYFGTIDRFIIRLVPGEIVDLTRLVKPENKVKFYRCLFYVMLACDLWGDISFNSEFTKLRLNLQWNEKGNTTYTQSGKRVR